MKFALTLCFILFSGVAAASLSGEVIHVSDGDTVRLLVGKETIRIRLFGIDAPESKQAWGGKSRDKLRALVYRKKVRIIGGKKDRYGRVLGTIMLGDVNVNKEMVRSGMAWVYRQYNKDKSWVRIEEQARREKRGLWQEKRPVAPWDYRRQKREKSNSNR